MAYDNGSKMLIFIDAADDAAMYPVHSLIGVTFKALADAINKPGIAGNDGYVVVCDDVNSVFLHANILSCTVTLDS